MITEIVSLRSGTQDLEVAYPGGLIGVGTKLDPSVTKSDNMMGNVVGRPGSMPPVLHEITVEYSLLERVVGLEKEIRVEPLRRGELLMLNVGTAVTIGLVRGLRGDEADLLLRIPIAAYPGMKLAISRQIGGRWRLIGYGMIKG